MMRRYLVVSMLLAATLPGASLAQIKPVPRPTATGVETRYFTSIDGLMDGNADVVLKETRQGKTVTAATLDVCYPAEKGSERKDRFVANLTVNGNNFTGSAQSIGDKLPVVIKLMRKPTGDTFEFKGQITVGQTTTEVLSTDNSDLSENEFKDSQTIEDSIVAAPKDFTEVSPEALAVKVKLDAAVDLLKTLKGQNVEVLLNSLSVSCQSLRSGEQVINLSVDPARAAALLGTLRATPGVVSAGWTSGVVDLERSIRFPAAGWRNGDKLDRDKLAAVIGAVMTKTLSAQLASSAWSDVTGKLTLTLKRPSQVLPTLGLVETLEVTALVAGDKPGASDHLLLWVGSPSSSTADESVGPKLNLADVDSNDEEGDQTEDNGTVDALAKDFKAQRWNADKSAWQ